MDVQDQRVRNVRILGTMALVAGLLAAGVDLTIGSEPPGKGFVFIGLLVVTGLGLRLEAALRSR